MAKKVGRPSSYMQEIADKICEEIGNGKSLRSVCLMDGMPAMSSIFKWIREHEEFSKQYARATEERTEALAEEILDISDDGRNDWMTITTKGGFEKEVANNEVLQRSRLRVDTRKWLMSKMKPKKYGDKIDLSNNGKDFPTPILGVLSNDLNKENSKPE